MGSSWIEIDARRLRENLDLFRRHLKGDAKLMAVVKANAYGHGAALVTSLAAERVDWWGVDSVEEAEEIQPTSSARPVLVLGHTEPMDAERVVAGGFRQVLFRRDVGEALSRAAARMGRRAPVHLKVETGLHRLGIPLSEVGDWAQWIQKLPGVALEGVYTHFADVEDPQSTLVREQLARLLGAVRTLEASGHRRLLVHAVPSAGALLHVGTGLAIARVGIGLYGIWPSAATRREVEARTPGRALLPVLSWKSRLAQVKLVAEGDTVGYDLTYRSASARRIGVVPVGYADGYDRKLSNRGFVLVRGQKAPVVGRVAMNMLMVDVSEAEAREGDEVVLLGEQAGERVTAEDLAEASGTIAYEILARLNPRLPRRIVGDSGEPAHERDVGRGPVERS
jgi:alanine racemase